jgi:ribosomal protein S18 acetylase RimI-like enzyme
MILLRPAVVADIPAMKALILGEGPNRWNHLPPDEVRAHLDAIATGETLGVLALDSDTLVGIGTFRTGTLDSFPLGTGFAPAHAADREQGRTLGYVAEVVVHRSHAGRGIGTMILERVKESLWALGADAIYLKRHEENAGSAAIMRKAGFIEVALFDDPGVRISGSRRTSVSRFGFEGRAREG